MSLFKLDKFPICSVNGINRTPISELEEIESGIFKRRYSDDVISLYDSLKTSMDHGIDQLIQNYSNITFYLNVSLTIGNITRVEVNLPTGFEVYSIDLPTMIMGPNSEHCIPHVFKMGGNTVLIGTTAHQVESNPIGKKLDLHVSVCCYSAIDAPGWKKVLYSGLSNLSKRNTNVSLILLITAVELYADYLIKQEIIIKKLDKLHGDTLISSMRQWHQKRKFISEMIKINIPEYDAKRIDKVFKDFSDHAKKPRNKYAHEHSEDITIPEAHKAYCSSFDLLWMFDKLEELLVSD